MPKSLDTLVDRITREYEAKGYTPEHAREVAWATLTRLGYVTRVDGHEVLTPRGEATLS
jgi:hypothetical protein